MLRKLGREWLVGFYLAQLDPPERGLNGFVFHRAPVLPAERFEIEYALPTFLNFLKQVIRLRGARLPTRMA